MAREITGTGQGGKGGIAQGLVGSKVKNLVRMDYRFESAGFF